MLMLLLFTLLTLYAVLKILTNYFVEVVAMMYVLMVMYFNQTNETYFYLSIIPLVLFLGNMFMRKINSNQKDETK